VHVRVTPLYVKGKKIPKAKRKEAIVYDGELAVREHRISALGRSSLVAQLLDAAGGLNTPKIELFDARLNFIENKQMRFSGYEVEAEENIVEGPDGKAAVMEPRLSVLYGQVWDVEVQSVGS
jgi:hypothetical protein